MIRHLLKPLPFAAGLVTGGLLVSILLVSVTWDSPAASAVSGFLYKWQTLFAGLFGIVAGGFAVVAAIVSARHGERLAQRQQKLKEAALCSIIRQDTIQTLQVVRELETWVNTLPHDPHRPIPYRNFVMGVSLVNAWSAFPFVPAGIARELFTFSHAMFDCQIRTRQLGELERVDHQDSAVGRFSDSVIAARSAGEALLARLDAI